MFNLEKKQQVPLGDRRSNVSPLIPSQNQKIIKDQLFKSVFIIFFMNYNYSDHIDITGKSLEELFMCTGMRISEMLSEKQGEKKIQKKISLEAKDRKELLYRFLEEIFYLYDIGGFLISQIEQVTISSIPKVKGIRTYYHLVLHATILGYTIRNHTPSCYHIEKIMSIHEMLEQGGKKFSAQIALRKDL